MKIENLKLITSGDRTRAAATVTWEDCDRPARELYIETPQPFADDLSCNPHSFLLGCIIPALHHGERRIYIDAAICPELKENLITAMSYQINWFGLQRDPVQIHAKTQTQLTLPTQPRRAASFFSGGVDSFSTVRANRLKFSSEHPRYIKDGLLVYGFDLGQSERDTRLPLFEEIASSLSKVATAVGMTLIPVYTNIRHLNNQGLFWGEKFHGAALAAVAHAFSRRLSHVAIASSDTISTLKPYGSHPLLDPLYGSYDLSLQHDNIRLSRFQKTQLITGCEVSLQNLRVCTSTARLRPGELNCGRCEKCYRTMAALVALGVLHKTSAFPKDDLTEQELANVHIDNRAIAYFYQEMLLPLELAGRHDLVRGIEHSLRICQFRLYGRQVKRFGREALQSLRSLSLASLKSAKTADAKSELTVRSPIS